MRATKNKVAPPFRVAELDLLYDEGISREGELVDLGTVLGVITRSGAYYSYGETRLGHGRDMARRFLKDNGDLAFEIEEEIAKTVNMPRAFSSPARRAQLDAAVQAEPGHV